MGLLWGKELKDNGTLWGRVDRWFLQETFEEISGHGCGKGQIQTSCLFRQTQGSWCSWLVLFKWNLLLKCKKPCAKLQQWLNTTKRISVGISCSIWWRQWREAKTNNGEWWQEATAAGIKHVKKISSTYWLSGLVSASETPSRNGGCNGSSTTITAAAAFLD